MFQRDLVLAEVGQPALKDGQIQLQPTILALEGVEVQFLLSKL